MSIPVILDTDIGGDIDDTWALAMLLRCPELDPRLVVTASGDTTYRARVAAGILAAGGRGDIPVGIGPAAVPEGTALVGPQAGFAEEVDLNRYAGGVHSDGVRALVDCVMGSPTDVTIITIGPVTNIAAALALEPAITSKARIVGMLGSVRAGLMGQPGAIAEYNVMADVPACRAVFAADWEVTITPLDTCGSVVLRGERYARLRSATDPLMSAVLRNYDEWCQSISVPDEAEEAPDENALWFRDMNTTRTSVLFDTVAVYLAYDEALVHIERLPIALDDDGTMKVTPGAPELRVATAWRDEEKFADHLVDRLAGA